MAKPDTETKILEAPTAAELQEKVNELEKTRRVLHTSSCATSKSKYALVIVLEKQSRQLNEG